MFGKDFWKDNYFLKLTIMKTTKKAPTRPLYEIAAEIKSNWKKEISDTELSPYAEPYIFAMFCLNKITDKYFNDSAEEIVSRFLCNDTSWRGKVARRVKKELNAMLK